MLKCLFELYMLLKVSQTSFPNSTIKLTFFLYLKCTKMLVCSFKVTLGKSIVSQSNNIMHYIMFLTVLS